MSPIVKGIAECMLEVLTGLFNHESYSNKTEDYYEQTYNYWKDLPFDAREYYFNSNYKLQEYGQNYFYYDREQCARSVADIAKKERRLFCSINNPIY